MIFIRRRKRKRKKKFESILWENLRKLIKIQQVGIFWVNFQNILQKMDDAIQTNQYKQEVCYRYGECPRLSNSRAFPHSAFSTNSGNNRSKLLTEGCFPLFFPACWLVFGWQASKIELYVHTSSNYQLKIHLANLPSFVKHYPSLAKNYSTNRK